MRKLLLLSAAGFAAIGMAIALAQQAPPPGHGAFDVGTPVVGPSTAGSTALAIAPGVQHPATAGATGYANTIIVTDTVTGAVQGVQEGLRINLTNQDGGSGSIINGGHNVAFQVEGYNTLTASQLMIPIESILSNAAGTLAGGWGFLSKLTQNLGTIGTLDVISSAINNGGTIGNFATVHCNVPTTPGTITNRWCIRNDDPLAQITTAGIISNSTFQEFGPNAGAMPLPGRYYWGVSHGATSGTIGNLNTNTYWAPYLQGGRVAMANLGVRVVTPAAGATCSLAIYKAAYGFAWNVPIYGPYTVSAATAGDVEANVAAPYIALDAGLYIMGVNCSSNVVTIAAYAENEAFIVTGPSSSQGSDVAQVTAGTAFGTNPAISYVAGNSLPQIWVRR